MLLLGGLSQGPSWSAPWSPHLAPARPAPAVVHHLALEASNPADELERGAVAFARGEYARTIEIIKPLLYPEPRLQQEGRIAQAHRMLGVAHLFERQNSEAAEEFRKLLQLRPDYRMDPLLDPSMVVDFFNNILKQQEAALAELARKRKEADDEEARRRRAPVVVERRVARNSFAVSFLPFGAGQFQNGQRAKGWMFLTAESVFGAVSVAALTTNFALYGVRPRLGCTAAPAGTTTDPDNGCLPGLVPNSDRDRSQLILKVQLVSGVLFFATAIWGVVDAVVNFRPEIELPLTPPPAPPAPSGVRLGLVTFGEGGLGGGLTFRF
jgi:hypothetical protein